MGFCVVNKETWEYVQMNTTTCRYNITKNFGLSHRFKKRKSALNFLENDTQKILNKHGWDVMSDSIIMEMLNKKGNMDVIDGNVENIINKNVSDNGIINQNFDEDIPDTIKPFIEASQKIELELEDMEKLKHFKHYEADAKLSESFEVPNIDIVETIKQFEIFLKKMKDYADVLSKQYTYIENAKLDFEHKIEFDADKLPALKQIQLLNNYMVCLEERRRIKDDIIIIEKLLNASVTDFINGEFNKFFNKMESRKYRPRVAPELFANVETVQVKPRFHLDNMLQDSVTHDAELLNAQIDTQSQLSTGGLLGLISDWAALPDCGE